MVIGCVVVEVILYVDFDTLLIVVVVVVVLATAEMLGVVDLGLVVDEVVEVPFFMLLVLMLL